MGEGIGGAEGDEWECFLYTPIPTFPGCGLWMVGGCRNCN